MGLLDTGNDGFRCASPILPRWNSQLQIKTAFNMSPKSDGFATRMYLPRVRNPVCGLPGSLTGESPRLIYPPAGFRARNRN